MYDFPASKSEIPADTRKTWELPDGLQGLRAGVAALPDPDQCARYRDDGRDLERVYANSLQGLELIRKAKPAYSRADLVEARGHLDRLEAFWRGIAERNRRSDFWVRADSSLKRISDARAALEEAAVPKLTAWAIRHSDGFLRPGTYGSELEAGRHSPGGEFYSVVPVEVREVRAS